jgi:hypothetical protein
VKDVALEDDGGFFVDGVRLEGARLAGWGQGVCPVGEFHFRGADAAGVVVAGACGGGVRGDGCVGVLLALEIEDVADAGTEAGCGDAHVCQVSLGFDVSDQCAFRGEDLVFHWERVELEVFFCEEGMTELGSFDGGATS